MLIVKVCIRLGFVHSTYQNCNLLEIDEQCFIREDLFNSITEWRYNYNPFGEREAKHYVQYDISDPMSYYGITNPMVYYLLGSNNLQYAVYEGFRTHDEWIRYKDPYDNSASCDISLHRNSFFDGGGEIYLYPAEYNIFGNGSVPVISWKYSQVPGTGDPKWVKEYNVTDHLGSVITSFRVDDNNNGELVSRNYFFEDGRRADLTNSITSDRKSKS